MGTIVITGEQVEVASIIALRAALRLQARGMRLSRGPSALSIAKKRGFTKARTAADAIKDLDAILAPYGV